MDLTRGLSQMIVRSKAQTRIQIQILSSGSSAQAD